MSRSVIAIIPARGGSKGFKNKNIAIFNGKPLITHTIESASESKTITQIVLSTDSKKIRQICERAGLPANHLRPKKLARDETPTLDVIRYELKRLSEELSLKKALILILQPTAPLRTKEDIDNCVQRLKRGYDSCVSVTRIPLEFHPNWQFKTRGNRLLPFSLKSFRQIPSRRQILSPPTFIRNGAVYAFKYESFLKSGNFYGDKVAYYEMPLNRSVNIDYPEDLEKAETFLKRS